MIYNAKIVDNKPCCSQCGSNNISGIRDYKECVMGGNTLTMFYVKCYSCRSDLRYLADVYMEKTTRYEVTGDIKEVKEYV